MSRKHSFVYCGETWKQCVAKYGITPEQLVDQFHLKLPQAKAMVEGHLSHLPDAGDVARMAQWYQISKADQTALNDEFDANFAASRNRWASGIDHVGPDKKRSDAVRGQEYRDKPPAAVSVAVAIPKVNTARAAAPAKTDATKAATPPKSRFVHLVTGERAHANGKVTPTAEEKDPNALPPLSEFKAMGLPQQFNRAVQSTGKNNKEIAQLLDVSESLVQHWRHDRYKRGSHYAPAPVILERFVRAFNIGPDYAEALLERKAMLDRVWAHKVARADAAAADGPADGILDHDDAAESIRTPKKEFETPIKGSGVAEFLERRRMNPTPDFLAGFLRASTANGMNKAARRRAKEILLGAPMTEEERFNLQDNLRLDAAELAMVNGPVVTQLLHRRHLGGGSGALAQWLGDGNGHAVTGQRIGQIMHGAPLTAEEIAMLVSNLEQAGKRLTPNELQILRSQPEISPRAPQSHAERLAANDQADTKSKGVA